MTGRPPGGAGRLHCGDLSPGANRASTVVPSVLARAKASWRVGSYLLFSMALMVWRDTPQARASCSWDRPRARRRSWMMLSMSATIFLPVVQQIDKEGHGRHREGDEGVDAQLLAADDAAQFEVLTGEKAQTENVAIRPEVISLSVNPVEQPDSYLRKGKIINSVPHGNVIRYSIACDDVTLRVDVLFSDAMLLAEQSEVYCSIAKDNCLMLE